MSDPNVFEAGFEHDQDEPAGYGAGEAQRLLVPGLGQLGLGRGKRAAAGVFCFNLVATKGRNPG